MCGKQTKRVQKRVQKTNWAEEKESGKLNNAIIFSVLEWPAGCDPESSLPLAGTRLQQRQSRTRPVRLK
jgi:hypothetical protein